MDAVISHNSRAQALWRQIERLSALQAQAVSDKAQVLLGLEECHSYLSVQDEVAASLSKLQDRTQSDTKALYESLLTALLHEVMPHKLDNNIVLSLGMKNNRPELNVDIEVNGEIENVYQDKGGSINNIISMGLRFIVLSQTPNRRFVLFDEADAWLNSEYVPKFASIMEQLSKKMGVQVLYVSHHSPECFTGKAKIIQLMPHLDGHVKTKDISSEYTEAYIGMDDADVIPEMMEGVGIRNIRLINFRQHKNTLIELSKNVTVLTGDQDLGKSAVLEAFECVSKNLGREGLIRHGAEQCVIQIGIEEDMALTWTYKKKSAKKTAYKLEDKNGVILHESTSGVERPEWLVDYLAMEPIGDVDPHFSDQFNPCFMIGKGTTAHKRAELLSVGKGSNTISLMMKRHQENIKEYKSSSKELNRQLAAIKSRLDWLRPACELSDDIQSLVSSCLKQETEAVALSTMAESAHELLVLIKRKAVLQTAADLVLPVIHIEKNESAELISLIAAINGKTDLLGALAPIKKVDVNRQKDSVLAETSELGATGAELKRLSLKLRLLNEIPALPNTGSVDQRDNDGLSRAMGIINRTLKTVQEKRDALYSAKKNLDSIGREKAGLISDLGGVCPFCRSPLSPDGYTHSLSQRSCENV